MCLLGDNLVYLAVNKPTPTSWADPGQGNRGALDWTDPLSQAKATPRGGLRVLRTGLPFDHEMRVTGASDLWMHMVRVPVCDKDGTVMGRLRTPGT